MAKLGNKPVSNSIFESLSEEEIGKITSYKENIVTKYEPTRANNQSFSDIAWSAYNGALYTTASDILSQQIGSNSATRSRDYIYKTVEIPIIKDILDRKAAALSGYVLTPKMVSMTPLNDVEKMNKVTKTETILTSVASFIYTKEMDTKTRHELNLRALVDGAASVRLATTGLNYDKLFKDSKIEVIPTWKLLYDYDKHIQDTNAVIELNELSGEERQNFSTIYEERYQQIKEQEILEARLKGIELEISETIPVYSMYFRTNEMENIRKEIIYEAIYFEEVLVEVIETTHKSFPYETLSYGTRNEFYRNSDVLLLMPLYDLYQRNETGISRLIAFSHQPQVEISNNALMKTSYQSFAKQIMTPGAVLRTKTGNNVRVLDRKNEVALLQQEYARIIDEMYRVVGLNKTSMGESSGSLTTSTGVAILTENAEKGLSYQLGYLTSFTKNVNFMLLNYYLFNSETLPYLSQDDSGTDIISQYDTSKLEGKSLQFIKMNEMTEQENQQVSMNFLMQTYAAQIQYGADDPVMQQKAQVTYDALIETIPMSADTRNRMKLLNKTMEQATQSGYNQGVVEGTGAMASILETTMKSTMQ